MAQLVRDDAEDERTQREELQLALPARDRLVVLHHRELVKLVMQEPRRCGLLKHCLDMIP